jgi:protoporphyrin/coproporphyrin ferrochelatase
MQKRTAVLLVNLGSPDSPKPSDVRRYLTQFLNDPRVIDIPWLARKILVNGIIVPLRHRKSAKVYKELWTENGSPLVHYGRRNQQQLQEKFNEEEVKIFLAMRYQNPSLITTLLEIEKWSADKVIVIPLFPHYASATSGSVIEEVMRLMKDMYVIPETTFIQQFYDHPLFLKAFIERGRQFDWREYDHVLFSYHGLPERQLDKIYADRQCKNHSCEHEINEENRYCYKATCYATTREIAQALGIPPENYTVCFQSRLGRGWVEPFSDQEIKKLAKNGAKKLLIFSPAFVADCLETTIEIGEEYQELFEEYGGEKVQLVPSLNESETWVACLEDLVKKRL